MAETFFFSLSLFRPLIGSLYYSKKEDSVPTEDYWYNSGDVILIL